MYVGIFFSFSFSHNFHLIACGRTQLFIVKRIDELISKRTLLKFMLWVNVLFINISSNISFQVESCGTVQLENEVNLQEIFFDF